MSDNKEPVRPSVRLLKLVGLDMRRDQVSSSLEAAGAAFQY
jgi:hypothetical protein